MNPDKAISLGNDLACIAAQLAEIAEEFKDVYDVYPDQIPLPQDEPEPPKPITLETARGILADKSRIGHTEAVRELLLKHGGTWLSEISPKRYPELLKDAEGLR